MWLLDQLSQCKAVYNISLAWDCKGDLNVDVLQDAVNMLLARHGSLRTVFQNNLQDATVLEQVVQTSCTCEIQQVNASSREVAVNLARIETQTVFNLAMGPLVKATIFWISPTETVFQLTMHHIITDGWSSGIIKRDLAAFYNYLLRCKKSIGDSVSPTLSLVCDFQYTDFSIWQEQRLLTQSDVTSRQLSYWKEVLQDAPSHIELLTQKKSRDDVRTQLAANHYVTLATDLMQKLGHVAATANTTIFTVLLSALHLLLAKYSNQRDTVIGSPVSGRTCEEVSDIVGFFVNTVALRVKSTICMSLTELLQHARAVVQGAVENQDVPFNLVVGSLNFRRELGANPLFQVMLDF